MACSSRCSGGTDTPAAVDAAGDRAGCSSAACCSSAAKHSHAGAQGYGGGNADQECGEAAGCAATYAEGCYGKAADSAAGGSSADQECGEAEYNRGAAESGGREAASVRGNDTGGAAKGSIGQAAKSAACDVAASQPAARHVNHALARY